MATSKAPAPSTQLGKIIATGGRPVTPEASKTPLARVVGGQRGEDVTLPGLGRARMELLGAAAWNEVKSATHREMERLGLPFDTVNVGAWELERAARTLAQAVRDPADASKPFGTLDEWRALDPQLINAAWQEHDNVCDRLDPLERPLTDDEMLAIEVAVKKKDGSLLKSFGLGKLCAWLVTTAVPLAISPPPSSSSSESSSES